MGHELMATTLQLARACSVIANGGLLLQPRLTMKRQRPGKDPDGLEAVTEPVRVLKPETAITMGQMMKGVVLHGTGTAAQLKGYSSAGKTGSAQIFDVKAHAYTHKYNASFMGYAPVNNPAVVIVVTLHGATHYGGAVAAPVFNKVAMAALRILDIPKDQPEDWKPMNPEKPQVDDLAIAELGRNPLEEEEGQTEVANAVAAGVAADTSDSANVAGVPQPAPVPVNRVVLPLGPKVPNFRGKTLRDVLQESAALGMQVEYVGSGIARGQAPAPGSVLRAGESVRVEFAR
jgi:membrane peptidoglycan carboxypeptidase